MWKLALALPLLALVAACSQPANAQVPVQPTAVGSYPSAITVVGEGTAKADPDVAYVTTGVQTRAKTARDAQDQNTQTMSSVLAAVRALGVADADIRTVGLSLQPNYSSGPNQASQIDGYTAINSVTISVQDVTKVGAILDAAVGAGANQNGGVQFGLKNDAQARGQALGDAVRSARTRADAIASAAGVKITGIVSMTDLSSGATPVPPPRPFAVSGEAASAAGPVPVQPGQLNLTARVQVIFSVQ